MQVEVLLTENEIADQFVEAFLARNLPEKFFYWFPLSVKAWLNLCRDGEYKNFIRSFNLISAHSKEIVSFLAPEIEVISLGCGQGNKDVILLQEIRMSGRKVSYVPVDSSQALLEMACHEAIRAGVPYRAWKADVLSGNHIEAIANNNIPRLYMVLGNTLGGFAPVELSRKLGQLLRPQDHLLVDGEIQSTETIAGYDNPLNRKFAFAPLASIGITESDGKLVFETKQDPERKGLYYLAKHFQTERDLQLVIAGNTIEMLQGEKVEMNHSCKYSQQGFFQLLGQEGRLFPVWDFLSPDSRFLMSLVKKGSPV